MRLALIGVGRWGANIKRTLEGMGIDVVAYDDPSASKSTPALLYQGGSRPARSPLDKGELEGISGVLIATPGSTHAKIALPFIKKGLPVFIEKPMTTSLQDAKRLEAAAKESGSIVMVGHIHLYNPAFLKAKELLEKAGNIKYVLFEGMNWGPIREDMSAWWDWAPHDISMAIDLFGKPKSVQAWGNNDMATARVDYGDFPALINVTWLSPEKRKKMTVVGEKYAVVFDDVADEKVTVFRNDKISHPRYDKTSPLEAELKAFVQAIETGKKPVTDIQNGVDVVRVLDAGDRSMKSDGAIIKL